MEHTLVLEIPGERIAVEPVEQRGQPARPVRLVEVDGIDAINMHQSDWTGGLTTLFHRFDRYALSWDLQHERVLHDGFRMGVDGVFSDWVDRMMEAFRAEIGAGP